ncbi:hypothetical protein EUGRSUZ_F03597 [Eucalyptus grandis]|uniref:Uncharacterized protein n=2 Tax=Eucalyptus grandis TaxID=71139 RepID=A0ACC3KM81_EUCGR|nr:hypothetical protein EUGRSUZ_F03597 [Eucalyptus grandis]
MACGGQRLGRRRVAPPLPSSLRSGLFGQQRRRLRGLLALRRAEQRRQCRCWTDLQVALAASCSVSPVVAAAVSDEAGCRSGGGTARGPGAAARKSSG